MGARQRDQEKQIAKPRGKETTVQIPVKSFRFKLCFAIARIQGRGGVVLGGRDPSQADCKSSERSREVISN